MTAMVAERTIYSGEFTTKLGQPCDDELLIGFVHWLISKNLNREDLFDAVQECYKRSRMW